MMVYPCNQSRTVMHAPLHYCEQHLHMQRGQLHSPNKGGGPLLLYPSVWKLGRGRSHADDVDFIQPLSQHPEAWACCVVVGAWAALFPPEMPRRHSMGFSASSNFQAVCANGCWLRWGRADSSCSFSPS